MADMKEILKRTKARSDKVKVTRLPPSIATTDRPYQIDQQSLEVTTNHKNHNKNKRKTDEKLRQTQTEDKLRTNRGQFEDKLRTIRGQTEDKKNKPRTNWGRKRGQFEDKLRTIRGQTEDKKADFFALSGSQKNITIYLYNICKISRDKATHPLSLELIANSCQTTVLSAKKTLQRLEKKGIITRNNFKSGRGGWTSYCLPNGVFQQVLYMETEDKSRTIRGQTEDKLGTELGTETRTSLSSSSSSSNIYNNKTTTTSGAEKSKLEDEWLKVNIEPLLNIGFTETHLGQIASQNLFSPDIVQNSIYAFAFDLENNDKAKTLKKDPINFFMGILRRGMPYAPPDNYEHPKDKATRLYLESMRKVVQKREKIRQEMMNVAFEDWYYKLENEDAKSFLPIEMKLPPSYANAPKESRIVKDKARAHFIENIWSTLQKTIEESAVPEEA